MPSAGRLGEYLVQLLVYAALGGAPYGWHGQRSKQKGVGGDNGIMMIQGKEGGDPLGVFESKNT